MKWLGMCLFTFISWWICVDTVLCVRACAVCLRSLSAVCVCKCVIVGAGLHRKGEERR